MPFDDSTRGRLQRFVGTARALLAEEFTRQLQQDYGLDPSTGDVATIDSLADHDDRQRETAGILREIMQHYLAADFATGREGRRNVLDRIVREQAFTVLNQLAALRMMEARGILIEPVAKGYQSRGFQLYQRVANGALGETGQAYRCFLSSVFDTFAAELPALFDRHAPHGRLFPREAALLGVLKEFDAPDLEPLWGEDETIGWIYQYFNSREERQAMRKASQAPRNSRELAVRNQFFTPRYVVEFLVDNTLGRLWFNWTGGETCLRDRCQFLLAKPDEQPQPAERLRDPRTIKLLDPACGSMHFGLYAFDLFLEIYREAWAWEAAHGPGSLDISTQPEAGLKPLSETYLDETAFLRDAPRLIIEHNIYGVEIDPRAAQIASLALWLRAQRAWHDVGVKATDRPAVGRGNVVAAVAPPAEVDLRKELMATMDETDAELFEKTLFLLKGLPELGVLLQAERELPALIRQIYREQTDFLRGGTKRWRDIETRLRDALARFARVARSGYQSRLFAEDALEGLQLTNLSEQKFDAVVMNPPFGEVALDTKDYLYKSLPEAARDLFAGFVSRSNDLLTDQGRLGVLSNRTAFFSEFLASWRVENFLGRKARLALVADLGYGVLDAVVEAACYVCAKDHGQDCQFLNVLNATEKGEALHTKTQRIRNGNSNNAAITRRLESFESLPDYRFAYQLHPDWIKKLNLKGDHDTFVCKGGLTSGDDTRNLRLFWEPQPAHIGKRWGRLAKGGEFSRYRGDLHLLVDWQNREHLRRLGNYELFGRRGVTYTERTTSNLSARVLNEGSYFSNAGPGIFAQDNRDLHFVLAYMNSFLVSYCIESLIGGGDYSAKGTAARHFEPGYMVYLPNITLTVKEASWFSENVTQLLLLIENFVDDETDSLFKSIAVERDKSLRDGLTKHTRYRFGILQLAYQIVEALEKRISALICLPEERLSDAYPDTGWPWPQNESLCTLPRPSALNLDPLSPHIIPVELEAIRAKYRFEMKLSHYLHAGVERYAYSLGVAPTAICYLLSEQSNPSEGALLNYVVLILSYSVGAAFGRWDIRYATGEKLPPEFPDPFARLPICPPGQLQNAHGLPIAKAYVEMMTRTGGWDYPIAIPWEGILVDDPGNPLDLQACVEQMLQAIWGDLWEAIEQEVCEILNVGTLREFFRRPSGFFAAHLQRYSKSRRKAPIYWPLSTPSANFTLWLYYPALTDQTLYTAANDFVGPKLQGVSRLAIELRIRTDRGRDEERELEQLQNLEEELKELRDELLRLAPTWKPNHDDGVQITAAPLWRLFRHRSWQTVLKETWEKLEKGDYDWAHLAMSYWPGRVRDKCRTDESLAIAHNLEDLCEPPPEKTGAGRRRRKRRAETA
jgi:hypothetical protein